MKQLKELVLNSAYSELDLIVNYKEGCGFIPGGVNGPYLDIETPIRNSSHWLIVFSVAWELSGDKVFSEAAGKLYSFLEQPLEFRKEFGCIHRRTGKKDTSNGVIGPAWEAEALFVYGKIFDNEEAIQKSKKLINSIPFDEKYAAWERVDPEKGGGSIDWTYNHQAWFASTRALIFGSEDKKVDSFLDTSQNSSFSVYENGLICHGMKNRYFESKTKGLKQSLKNLAKKILRKKSPVKKINYEHVTGYHIYTLHSLARLKALVPNHSFWKTEKIQKAVNYSVSSEFFEKLEENRYSYPYNAPGLEYFLIDHEFSSLNKNTEDAFRKFLETQKEKTLDPSSRLFMKNTYDPLTLAARIYELAISLFLIKEQTNA